LKFKDEILEPLEVEIGGKLYRIHEDRETLDKVDKIELKADGSNITEFWYKKLETISEIPKTKIRTMTLRQVRMIVKWAIGEIYGTGEVASEKKDL